MTDKEVIQFVPVRHLIVPPYIRIRHFVFVCFNLILELFCILKYCMVVRTRSYYIRLREGVADACQNVSFNC